MFISKIFDSISSMPIPFNMITWIVLFGCVTGVVTEIAKQIRKYSCHRQELALKRELVDRGLEVGEIERIIAAQSGQKPSRD